MRLPFYYLLDHHPTIYIDSIQCKIYKYTVKYTIINTWIHYFLSVPQGFKFIILKNNLGSLNFILSKQNNKFYMNIMISFFFFLYPYKKMLKHAWGQTMSSWLKLDFLISEFLIIKFNCIIQRYLNFLPFFSIIKQSVSIYIQIHCYLFILNNTFLCNG